MTVLRKSTTPPKAEDVYLKASGVLLAVLAFVTVLGGASRCQKLKTYGSKLLVFAGAAGFYDGAARKHHAAKS